MGTLAPIVSALAALTDDESRGEAAGGAALASLRLLELLNGLPFTDSTERSRRCWLNSLHDAGRGYRARKAPRGLEQDLIVGDHDERVVPYEFMLQFLHALPRWD